MLLLLDGWCWWVVAFLALFYQSIYMLLLTCFIYLPLLTFTGAIAYRCLHCMTDKEHLLIRQVHDYVCKLFKKQKCKLWYKTNKFWSAWIPIPPNLSIVNTLFASRQFGAKMVLIECRWTSTTTIGAAFNIEGCVRHWYLNKHNKHNIKL